MQRLYSTFARGLPGVGLILLRLGSGILLIYFAIAGLLGADSGELVRMLLNVVSGLAGILLIIGLWTPLAGGVVALTQLWISFSQPFSKQAYPFVHILLAILSVALAMLGPGAWSIDARLFGRKRLIREP